MGSTDFTTSHKDEVQKHLAAPVQRVRRPPRREKRVIDRCPTHGVWRFEGVCDLCDE